MTKTVSSTRRQRNRKYSQLYWLCAPSVVDLLLVRECVDGYTAYL